jgi:hypothetical protein
MQCAITSVPKALLWALLLLGWDMLARADDVTRVGVVFHVAEQAGKPVATNEFIASELAHANEIYAPLGIQLVDVRHEPLPEKHAELVSRRDRDALARYLKPRLIHCMIVASLMDVDEPGRVRRGVHWHARDDQSKHFVIVSVISGPYVLAHELGHFFGNPSHSDTPDNLMSYTQTGKTPFLDEAQIARVRATVSDMVKRGELDTQAFD